MKPTMEPVDVVQWRILGDDDDTMTVVPAGDKFDPVGHGFADPDDIAKAQFVYGPPGYVVITRLDGLYQRGEA